MSGSRRFPSAFRRFNQEKRVRKFFVLVLSAMGLVGCATGSSHMNQVSIGMTKADVVNVLGAPESTRATGQTEYMIYTLRDRMGGRPFVDPAPYQVLSQYYVRLTGGRVDAYGQVGDFDSTHVPEQRLDVDVNVHGSPSSDARAS
jgi:hypothetical protein